MSQEFFGWGNEEAPEIPLYDQYTQFCDGLNQSFEPFDPIEIPDEIIQLRMFLGIEPLPRIGNVFTLSDSKLYDAFSEIEGRAMNQLEEDVGVGNVLAGASEDLSATTFLDQIVNSATYLQSQIDSGKPMDVTVQVHHVYQYTYEETLALVRDKATELGGRILNDDELSESQRISVGIKPIGVPYNYSSGFIVRFG